MVRTASCQVSPANASCLGQWSIDQRSRYVERRTRKGIHAWSRLLGRGDDSAVVILYTLDAQRAESDAVLAAFAADAWPGIEHGPERNQKDAMMTSQPQDSRPLIAHVVFRFAVGGLENGLVNLINRMPSNATVIAS